METKKKFVFGVKNDIEVEIDNQYLRIKKGNKFINQNSSAENKVIDLHAITAYKFIVPTKEDKGYIYIDYLGNLKEKIEIIDPFRDDNCILVTIPQYEDAKQLLFYLEGHISKKYIKNPVSFIADEIVKLHKLYELRLITAEQLKSEKNKLFNRK